MNRTIGDLSTSIGEKKNIISEKYRREELKVFRQKEFFQTCLFEYLSTNSLDSNIL